MKHMLGFIGLAALFLSTWAQAQPKEISVCDLVQRHLSPGSSLEVRVTGEILADRHSILIVSSTCERGIYLRHEWGQSGGEWTTFDRNLIQKRSVEEGRPLLVTLEGAYSIEKEEGKEYRVMNVKHVIVCKFGETESKP
jgi:hypothetical protein